MVRYFDSATPNRWRFFFIVGLLAFALLVLIARVVYLSVIDRSFLQTQGNARTIRVATIPANRGMITDRNGEPLAISTPVASVWADPVKFKINATQWQELCRALDMKSAELHAILAKAHKREFVYLKRRIDPEIAENIKDLKIPGIYLQSEYRRFYPEMAATAQVLGNTNIDDHGISGIELGFDKWLEGIVGLKRVLKDRNGKTIADIEKIRDPKPGHHLILSLDRRIQYLAYNALADGIAEFGAESGSVVVLDVKTGEILAMTNYPSFNPNEADIVLNDSMRNRAVTDVFEPGSTMKGFSIASLIASGRYHPDSVINTSPGHFSIGRNIVRDEHSLGLITLRTVLQKSSNVGTAKMILSLPPDNLWHMLKAVGFGESTNSGFPGERTGSLSHHRVTNPFLLATLSFGYGITVSPIQLAQAYAILAHKGVKIPVTFLKRTEPVMGKQVIDPKVAATMIDMMQAVLQPGGSGTRARVPGYHVAGKTGTARLVGPHGYEEHKHMALFVGTAPVADPRLVVLVNIKNPTKKFYMGGDVAGPIFSKIMEGALHILDIPPDDIESLQNNTAADDDDNDAMAGSEEQ